MKINDKEKKILDGVYGYFPQWAIKQQIKVGEFFDADQFIQVSECHLCADTESVGEQIIEELEQLYISDNKKVISATGWSPQKNAKNIMENIFEWISDNEHIIKQTLM